MPSDDPIFITKHSAEESVPAAAQETRGTTYALPKHSEQSVRTEADEEPTVPVRYHDARKAHRR